MSEVEHPIENNPKGDLVMEVVPLERSHIGGASEERGGTVKDQWQRRQALQIAALLPDDEKEAISILGWAERLIRYVARGKG